MGTHETYGYRLNNIDYLTYNHADSYPSGLGQDIVDDLKGFFTNGGTTDEIRTMLLNMRVVDRKMGPSKADRSLYHEYWDNVSSGEDWYSLLRKMQGHIIQHLTVGIMINNTNFMTTGGILCKWGYIIDLDTECLEIYRGYKRDPHPFAQYGHGDFVVGTYGCALIAEWPLQDLPVSVGNTIDDILGDPEQILIDDILNSSDPVTEVIT